MAHALEGTEAKPTSGAEVGRVEAEVSKNGREVLVHGRAKAAVTMPCARTLEPLEISIDVPFYLLLRPRGGAAGREGAASSNRAPRAGKRIKTPPERPSTSRKRGGAPESLSEDAAAGDFYDGEMIVLDDFVREHILLELPMFPVRSDLHSSPVASIGAPSPTSAADSAEGSQPLDPRLVPLAKLAEAMKKQVKE